MKITYVHGDLFTGKEPALVHGCNMQGRLGKGFADALIARYPAAKKAYHDAFADGGLHLGEIVYVQCDPHFVMNAITQRSYDNAFKTRQVYVDYGAVEHVFRMASDMCRTMGFASLALPLIGSGLAGGSWTRVASIVESATTHVSPVVYLLDGKVPTT